MHVRDNLRRPGGRLGVGGTPAGRAPERIQRLHVARLAGPLAVGAGDLAAGEAEDPAPHRPPPDGEEGLLEGLLGAGGLARVGTHEPPDRVAVGLDQRVERGAIAARDRGDQASVVFIGHVEIPNRV